MLNPQHQAEIVEGSGVSAVIAELNFWTVTDPSEADGLLNRNADKRWKHSDNLVPGWAVAGIEPQTEERWLQGVQLKPDTPALNQEGKAQKYLGVSGYDSAPLFLDNGQPGYWPNVLSDRSIPIYITEGAKKAACLLTLAYAAISLPGVWNGQIKGRLKKAIQQFCGVGRKVYLCFDSDQVSNPQVQKALDRLGKLLSAEGCVVYVVTWNEQYKGMDDLVVGLGSDAVHTAIKRAQTFEEWRSENKPNFIQETKSLDSHLVNQGDKEPRKTAGDKLLEIAQRGVTYFHTPDKVAYADIWIEGNRHTYAVRSKAFRLWLSGQYFEQESKGIGSQTLQDTLSTLEAIALFKGETHQVHLRVAEYQGKIYLDLGTPDWKAVEVDTLRWRLVSDYPVRFWRPDSLLPLPYPEQGGSLEELKGLLNVEGSAWTLIIGHLEKKKDFMRL